MERHGDGRGESSDEWGEPTLNEGLSNRREEKSDAANKPVKKESLSLKMISKYGLPVMTSGNFDQTNQ
jgi:hypothetical protein